MVRDLFSGDMERLAQSYESIHTKEGNRLDIEKSVLKCVANGLGLPESVIEENREMTFAEVCLFGPSIIYINHFS